jgi:hypothetical protein
MADRKAGGARAAAIADQMAALRAVPEPEPEPEPAKTEAAAPKPRRATRARKAAQAPAQQRPQGRYDVRIPFMTDDEQRKALAAARIEDQVEVTTRLRAMVQLWMTNKRFRSEVDELAADMRLKERLARGYRR